MLVIINNIYKMKYLKVFEEYSDEIFNSLTRQQFSLSIHNLLNTNHLQKFDKNDISIISKSFYKENIESL